MIDGDAATLWTPATATGLDFPGQAPARRSWSRRRGSATARCCSAATSRPGPGGDVLAVRARRRRRQRGPLVQRRRRGVGDRVRRRRLARRDPDRGDRGRRRRSRGDPDTGRPAAVHRRRPGAAPALRCELALRPRTPTARQPDVLPRRHPPRLGRDRRHPRRHARRPDDCAAIREQVVTLPGAWEPYWTPATPGAAGGGTARPSAPLTLSVSTRSHPHRTTLRKRGLRVPGHGQRAATVRLSVRVAGTKRFAAVATRRLPTPARRDPPRSASGRATSSRAKRLTLTSLRTPRTRRRSIKGDQTPFRSLRSR